MDLKRNIKTEIDNISPDLCRKVFDNLQTQLQCTVQMDGKHLKGIILKNKTHIFKLCIYIIKYIYFHNILVFYYRFHNRTYPVDIYLGLMT